MISSVSTQGTNLYSSTASDNDYPISQLAASLISVRPYETLNGKDVFQTSKSNDKQILNKLKEDIDNCKREDFESDEKYNEELERRITIYMETQERIDKNNNNNNSEKMALIERYIKAVGEFARDIGAALKDGGEVVLNFLTNFIGI